MISGIRTALVRRFAGGSDEPVVQAELNSEAVRAYIRSARNTQRVLSDFVNENVHQQQFVSLGQNCSTAWYLKQVGVKLDSYPFDWIFSSCEVVEDCIENQFSFYQDQSQFSENSDGSAGHRRYHSRMFNHRSPLSSEETYSYYQRCCERFLALLASEVPCIFVITLINEHEKRPDWANGFSSQFLIPRNQHLDSVMPLLTLLKTKNKNSRMVVVEQYTDTDPEIESKRVNEDIFYIKHGASGGSSGTRYNLDIDDFCFRQVMSALV